MHKANPRFRWIRGAAVSLCVFLLLAVLIPNLTSFVEIAIIMSVLFVPLACIHFGVEKFPSLEFIGWLLLVVFLVLAMLG
jgi:uncharacterized membrane protein YdcZ (DUF606 family)